ncbi:hypothetical protein ACA910_009614 [Epithemia clementina (nom. ined.)]
MSSQPENLNLLASEAEILVRWFQFLEIQQEGGQRPNGAFLDPTILEHSFEFCWVITVLAGAIFYNSWENGLDIIEFLTIMQKMKMVSSEEFARLIMDTDADKEGRGAEVQTLPTTYYSQERQYITCEQAVKALLVFNILDHNNSGAMDFKSFSDGIKASGLFDDLEHATSLFRRFDDDRSGNLDVVEAMELFKMLNQNHRREDLQLAAAAIQLKALQQVRATAMDRSSSRNGEAWVFADPAFVSFEDIWPALQNQLHFPESKWYAEHIFLLVTNGEPQANAQQVRQFMQHNDIRRHLNDNERLQTLQERAKLRAASFEHASRTSPSPYPSPTNANEPFAFSAGRESRFQSGQEVAKMAFGLGAELGGVDDALGNRIETGFINRMEENLGEGSPSSTMSELAQLDLGQTAGAAMKEGLLNFAGAVAENLTAELGLQMSAEVLSLLALDCVVPGAGIMVGFAFNVGTGGRIRRMIFQRRPRQK